MPPARRLPSSLSSPALLQLIPLALATALASHLQAALPTGAAAFLENHCSGCHDAADHKGGLNLDALKFDSDPANHAKWVRIFDRVLNGEMPPPKKPRPEAAAQRAFLTGVGQGLLQQHTAIKGTVLRRLNRTEYENTLRDLLGMRVEVRDLLPEDSLSHGFDNIGEALSMSDVQLARYLEAAELALNTVLQRSQKPEVQTSKYDYTKSVEKAKSWLKREDGAVVIFNDGGFPDTTLRDFRAPSDGLYRFRVTGYGYQAKAPVLFAFYSGLFGSGTASGFHGFHALTPDTSTTITIDVPLRLTDTVKISPELSMNYNEMQKNGPAAYPGPGIAIKEISVEGPIFTTWPPRGASLLFGDLLKDAKEADEKKFRNNGRRLHPIIEVTPAEAHADAARLLRGFASAAFRRPADEAKVAPYLALFEAELKKGSSFSISMRTAAIAILCAPDFLYLREPAGKLDDYALATRLSYFLARTTPDEVLLKIAASGKLREPATLRAQTERLLNAPTLANFTEDFTDAWLNLRDIDFTTPDKKLYPEFDAELQHAMVDESRGFFQELIKSNLSPTQIVRSDFTIVNERLAQHYGIPGVSGLEMRKVKLAPDSHRGGILTQGAILKVSANGTNTSPVVRGAWVLDRILGNPPPPPPPGIPGVEPDIRGATTLREQLDKHRHLETCNSCHQVIDPPGFALENYDVIGGWREKFRTVEKGNPSSLEVRGRKVNFRLGPPVDATGKLADGTPFKDFSDFQNLLLAKPDRITKCIAEKLLTFGSGRELGFSDRTEVKRITDELTQRKGGLRDLLHLVVGSQIFQTE